MNDQIEKLKERAEAAEAEVGQIFRILNLPERDYGALENYAMNKQAVEARVAELEVQVALDDKTKRAMVQWAELERKQAEARVKELVESENEELAKRVVAEARFRTAEGYIDQISLACGFPIVENREQVTNTIIKRITKLTTKAEQLRTVTEAADAMKAILRDEATLDGKPDDEQGTRREWNKWYAALGDYEKRVSEIIARYDAARSAN